MKASPDKFRAAYGAGPITVLRPNPTTGKLRKVGVVQVADSPMHWEEYGYGQFYSLPGSKQKRAKHIGGLPLKTKKRGEK